MARETSESSWRGCNADRSSSRGNDHPCGGCCDRRNRTCCEEFGCCGLHTRCTGYFYDVDVDCADALATGNTFATVALVGLILIVVGLLITTMGALLKRETPSNSILS